MRKTYSYKRYYLATAWQNIKDRCFKPYHKNYPNYGGRGITMFPDWVEGSHAFREWVLENLGNRPGPKYSLDRIDNDGNYEPGNLHWATQKEQAGNRRARTKGKSPQLWILYEGNLFTAKECAQYLNITPHIIYNIHKEQTRNRFGLTFL